MTAKKKYPTPNSLRWPFKKAGKFCMVFTLVIFQHFFSCAQETSNEEVLLTLQVQRVGSVEVLALVNGNNAYLPVTDVFNFLKIKNLPSETGDSLTGFFIDPKAGFLIDKTNNRIVYLEKEFKLDPADLIKTETALYLKSEHFGSIFALTCTFNFRNLSVALSSTIELPLMREMRLEQMRLNLSGIKGEKKADTILAQNYPLFNVGVADWSFFSSQTVKGNANARVSLALGGTVAGGETNVAMNYNTAEAFTSRNLFYRWRYVDNNKAAFKQVIVGKYSPQTISTLISPVVGFQLTNAPTTYRKSFGTYRITNKTEPGWTVEVYINNVLINYVKADASGFYTVEIPLVYGNTTITLHFYGPWGEERTEEQNIIIPFNLLPKNQFEYNLTAGRAEDEKHSIITRLQFNYGLNSYITIGGGSEYVSSLVSGKEIPFLNSAVRFGSGFVLSGEYAHNVRMKGMLTYNLPASVQAELQYVKYKPGQTAVRYSYLEERKAIISFPYRRKNFTTFSRLSVNQFMLPKSKFTNAEFLLSSIIYGVNSNLRTFIQYQNNIKPFFYSNLSLFFRFPGNIRFMPQVQYEYSSNRVNMVKAEIEKTLKSRVYLNLSFENSFVSRLTSFGLGVRYNFSFAQTNYSLRQVNKTTTFNQSARGSFIYESATQYLEANKENNLGRAGVLILTFLDLNWNGKRDEGEPKVIGPDLHINGRNIQSVNKDSTIRVVGLEPYTKYFIELSSNSFDNIAWQIRKRTMSVIAQPNRVMLIEIPVNIVGEVAGTVSIQRENGLKGEGRLIVGIYDQSNKLVAKTLTEPDGYFSYLGLPPGNYTVMVDPNQLKKLNMSSSPSRTFVIKAGKEGDIADGFDFVLQSIKEEVETGDIKNQ